MGVDTARTLEETQAAYPFEKRSSFAGLARRHDLNFRATAVMRMRRDVEGVAGALLTGICAATQTLRGTSPDPRTS